VQVKVAICGIPGALSAAIAVAACSNGAPGASGDDGGPNCGPLEYISSGKCASLQINSPPDATGWINYAGPDAETGDASSDSPALGDATIADGSGTADALEGSTACGIDLDALDLDVQWDGGTPMPP
jgi:hypothetical protein